MIAMESHRFIKSSKGGELLLCNSHLFRIQNKYKTSTYWKCDTQACPSKAFIKNNVLTVKGEHNHAPNLNKTRKMEIYNTLKSRSETEVSESVAKIYRQEMGKVSEGAACMPNLKSASAVMYKARAKVHGLPARNKTLLKTVDKKKFLVVDGRYLVDDQDTGTRLLEKGKTCDSTTSRQDVDDPNYVENEVVIPDVEMRCHENSESGPSSSLMSTSDIVVKEEIIESEEESDFFDDSSFNSTFADNSTETHSDSQTPSTSYLMHSETSNSNVGTPAVGQTQEGAMTPTLSKVKSGISTNFCDINSGEVVTLSNAPSSLNASSPDVSSRDESLKSRTTPHSVNSPIPPDFNINGPQGSSNTEPIPSGISPRTGSPALPQVLNSSTSLPSSDNNRPMQPSAPSNLIPFRPPRDQFDAYGEFIASKLRKLDQRSCIFIQNTLTDLIYKAELGMFLNYGVSASNNNNIQRNINITPHSQSESTFSSSGKENVQPRSQHLPPDFNRIGSENLPGNQSNQSRVPSHMPNMQFPPVSNNTSSENSIVNAPSQPRIIGNQWPPTVLNITDPENSSVNNPYPHQNRVPFNAGLSSASPVLIRTNSGTISANSSMNNPSSPQNRVPFHLGPSSVSPVLIPSHSYNNGPIHQRVPYPTRPRDEFDAFGQFIATKLRTLDPRSRAFVQTAFADLIFEAELGRFLSAGERSIFANRTNEIIKNMPTANVSELNSLANVVSNIPRHVAQPQSNFAPVGFHADQVPMEVMPNLHTVSQ